MINHYRTLGVDPQAEPVVIRSAYLALIRRYHPDKGGEEADAARAQAVTAAWEVLGDPDRRAAYDEARQAHFTPGGRGALAAAGSKVRGGAVARNLFLLLAAGTVALGWWAVKQPVGAPPPKSAAPAGKVTQNAPVEPAIRPDEAALAAAARRQAEEPPVRLPDVRPQPDIDFPVVLPALPVSDPVRLPVRTSEAQPAPRRAVAVPKNEPAVTPARPAEPRAVEAASAAAAAKIDLAPLERHLQLLTDQSIRFGTEAKRARLFATREAFLKRLRDCNDDRCRRDAYLSRNAEVGEIMRN